MRSRLLATRTLLALLMALGITGCSGFSEFMLGTPRRTHHNSSVVEFLYPDNPLPIEQPTVPRLALPLKVGVAFVPDAERNAAVITEEEKFLLMTHTMMDATVYDIASRKMLFRAPGTSRINSKATPVALSGQQREDRKLGFASAGQELLANLRKQLDLFKEQVKNNTAEVIVSHRSGYTGGGAVDLTGLLIFVMAGGAALCARKHS